jgi:predicted metalloprotease
MQQQSQGYIVPDSFTHGSSEQRVRWFRRGLETGDMALGDTFQAESL